VDGYSQPPKSNIFPSSQKKFKFFKDLNLYMYLMYDSIGHKESLVFAKRIKYVYIL